MKFNYNGHEYDAKALILGCDLKQMRLYAKITTSVAAEYMGIKSRKTIENWESGASSPGISQFLILCRYYDMDASKITALCMARAKAGNPVESCQPIDVTNCSTAE